MCLSSTVFIFFHNRITSSIILDTENTLTITRKSSLNLPATQKTEGTQQNITPKEPDANEAPSIKQEIFNSETDGHKLAGLRCEAYGGPSDEIAQQMVYWSDIPSDAKVSSPFRDKNKFLTFEPDHGGWNNIRMAMETGKC